MNSSSVKTSPRRESLSAHRQEVLDYCQSQGMSKVRVFGSVSTGQDIDGSDIDLLVDSAQSYGLLAQTRMSLELEEILNFPVDLVFENSIRPDLRERLLNEAVAL